MPKRAHEPVDTGQPCAEPCCVKKTRPVVSPFLIAMPKIAKPRAPKEPKAPKPKKVFDFAQEGDFTTALQMMQTPRHRSLGTRFGEEQLTLLHLAVQTDNVDAIKLLLDNGTPVDVPGGIYKHTFTPLIRALGRSNDEVVLLLLERGANPCAETACGQNAVNFALDKKRSDAVVQAILGYIQKREDAKKNEPA